MVLDGSITLVFGKERWVYGPGEACSVPAGITHEEHTEADGVTYLLGYRSVATHASAPCLPRLACSCLLGALLVEVPPRRASNAPSAALATKSSVTWWRILRFAASSASRSRVGRSASSVGKKGRGLRLACAKAW